MPFLISVKITQNNKKMEDELKPRFIESLQRNNDQIREDRARTIGADSELIYRRRVEDIELKIKRLEREQEGLIDISPLDRNSLTFADFQPEAFVQKDLEYSLTIRNLNIQLEVAVKRFEYLFGKTF
ncbi:hypothetical protein SAMN05421594_4591 [Chryseobacterium oleae]|uniref:Uncharacterized protein n=2 Tax=Chryseobacterium group TaxID=2782232 RepID=A0A1I5CPZ2_CHROL|nr:hypothetical protein SAMN05421594_4591 [Chryseobacterium oleae]